MANLSLLLSTVYGGLFSLFFVAQLADAVKEPTQINEFEQVNQVNLLNGEFSVVLLFAFNFSILHFEFRNLILVCEAQPPNSPAKPMSGDAYGDRVGQVLVNCFRARTASDRGRSANSATRWSVR